MEDFFASLGDEVQDADEETFALFSQAAALPDLGMIDPKAKILNLTIAGKDYTITQSPGLLQSNREQGTTGAAVWQTSVRVAGWLASPKNVLFQQSVLDGSSSVLELGSGISGIVACGIAPKVSIVIATDQQHLMKALKLNIDTNLSESLASTSRNSRKSSKARSQASKVSVFPLDWEEDDIPKQLACNGLGDGVDAVLACDCIFNYALIVPFVAALEDICRLRGQSRIGDQANARPTVCVIAQQLRQSEVFEQWLRAFMRVFRVWRIPDNLLSDGLRDSSGFAVHFGILR